MASSDDLRILFIETDPSRRRAVELYIQGFTSRGIHIEAIASANDAAEYAKARWDAILVSGEVPEPQRGELLRSIQKSLSNVPVINLAGYTDMVTTTGDSMMTDYLPKIPVSTTMLLKSASHVLTCRRLEKEIERLKLDLAEASRTDLLTGLWNRVHISDRLTEEYMSWQRYRTPLTICLMGIAEFDRINEIYGFELADEVLVAAGRIINKEVRRADLAGRFGNDTFCIVFPKTPTSSALVCIERIRKMIRRELFSSKPMSNFTVDACFGVAQLSEQHSGPSSLITSAHQALVNARKLGPGRIELAGPASSKGGPTVLVIDHHSSVLDLCCDVLQENGFIPTAARSGKDARRASASRRFDLYIVDLQLPDFDGKAFIQGLALGADKRPPIVAVTGEKNVDKEELRALGADQVLFKPFSHEEILKVAERLTRARKSPAETH